MKENERAAEIDQELLQAYGNRFIPRWDRYAVQTPEGSYEALRQPLTMKQVEAHLRGRITLGAYALDEQSRARWLCFDADGPEDWTGLLRLWAELRDQEATAYAEASRRGGHRPNRRLGWLFLAPLPGRDARRVGQWLL